MLIFMLSILLITFFDVSSSIRAIDQFNFTAEPNSTDENGIYAEISRRSRREPAIWGEPAPDYSSVQLDGYMRLLHTLLFVDSKITHHYAYNMDKIKRELLKLVREANDYFYQINVRIIVVDILETYRSDLSLYSFEEYRNRRISKFPSHDFAALISYRYAGGLAFVGGMCTSKAVMLCGFYPHNPPAMGGIFFHEVAHLIGVPHHNATDSINIANCNCPKTRSTTSAGCLKIPGYDHDCTLQQMVNMLERNRCLRHIKSTTSFFTPYTEEKSLALCGNGIIEGSEECDCGLQKLCHNWNCQADECKQFVKTWQLYVCFCAAVVLAVLAGVFYVAGRCYSYCGISTAVTYLRGGLCPLRRLQLPSGLKSLFCHFWHSADSNYAQTLRRSGHHFIGIPHKLQLDANGITVLIAPSDKECLVRKSTITRPTQPPPPPPAVFPARNTLNRTVPQIHGIAGTPDVKLSPPPVPAKPPTLSLKMITTGYVFEDNTYELPNTTRKRLSPLSSSIVRSSTVDYSQSSGRYTDYYDSISRKFDDDFDDDFDERELTTEPDGDKQQQQQHQPIQYAPIIPSKERHPVVQAVDKSTTASNVKIGPLHHFVKLAAREESFSSSESRSQLCPSDDTPRVRPSAEEPPPKVEPEKLKYQLSTADITVKTPSYLLTIIAFVFLQQ